MTQPAADARSQPRVRLSCRALLMVGGHVLEGRTTDISEGGIGLRLRDNIPAGQLVKVQQVLPDAKGAPGTQPVIGTIRVAFNVLSTDGVRTGGPWIDLTPASRSMVSNYVRQQMFKSP
ncbi:MAG TPA: PilZ domain-containing protein [Burkholderiaceae bacterium]|nr:PilZ domain-containing protein [Burkholderiaceae bacterium]